MNNEEKVVAKVVHVTDEYSVVINRGKDQGVKQGDTYLIYSLGPELVDPDTSESLGMLELIRGRAIVRHVQEKVSTLETIEFDETAGRRKIIKRDGGGILAISMGLSQREEIEEGPERSRRTLDAVKGDFAKVLTSK